MLKSKGTRVTDFHRNMLKRLRDEIYDCYVHSSCHLQATAFVCCVGIQMNAAPDREKSKFPWEMDWLQSLLRKALDCQADKFQSQMWHVDEVIEKLFGTGRACGAPSTATWRSREVFGACIHSAQDASGELSRYLSQATEVERIVSQYLLHRLEGSFAYDLECRFSGAALLIKLLDLAWVFPQRLSYHVRFNTHAYQPHYTVADDEDWLNHFDPNEVERDSWEKCNPFRDRRSLDLWCAQKLDLFPGLYIGTLDRDVRICTVGAIEVLLDEQPDAKTVPSWDRGLKELRFNGVLCKKYRQSGEKQFQILEAFEKSGWPSSVPTPFDDPQMLHQTIKDLNANRSQDSTIVFSVEGGRPRWSAVPDAGTRSPKIFRTS